MLACVVQLAVVAMTDGYNSTELPHTSNFGRRQLSEAGGMLRTLCGASLGNDTARVRAENVFTLASIKDGSYESDHDTILLNRDACQVTVSLILSSCIVSLLIL